MQQKNRKGLRLFFIGLHILIVLFYLLVCLVPYIHPGKFWFISLLGMGYPFLVTTVFVCLLITIFLRSKWFLLPLAALLISWQQLSVLFAVHFSKEFKTEKPSDDLRVLSWNVSWWTENKNSANNHPENSYRNIMMDLVQMQNADVLCFQEFFECYNQIFPANIPPLEKMGYKYHYFSPSSKIFDGMFQTGLAIFSRYPIVDSAFINKIPGEHSEGFSYVDIKFRGQTLRIFNTHLESAGIHDYSGMGQAEGSKNMIRKIRGAYYLRKQQADLLNGEMSRSPHPVIFCGDVDDVPNSYAYFKVKGNLQDAFLQKGFGLGRTFQFISPTLRIDYIMADKKLKIDQFTKLDYRYSDHFPLIMDINFK